MSLLPICSGTDLIVYALPSAYNAEFAALDLEVRELAGRLGSGIDH